MFPLPPGAYRYRPLKRGASGWDVYALQTALKGHGHVLVADGVFGLKTDAAVGAWQEAKQLVVDAIAGVVTQRSLALAEGEKVRDRHGLPIKLLMGQMEKESGYLLGNHTARYEDGAYDLGVCQINNEAKKLTVATCFDVPYAINFLAEEVREKHDRYLTAPLRPGSKRVENRRAWRLAAGSWNRPAHTAYLAGMQGDDPVAPSSRILTSAQEEWIRGYIDRVCTYCDAYYGTQRAWPK